MFSWCKLYRIDLLTHCAAMCCQFFQLVTAVLDDDDGTITVVGDSDDNSWHQLDAISIPRKGGAGSAPGCCQLLACGGGTEDESFKHPLLLVSTGRPSSDDTPERVRVFKLPEIEGYLDRVSKAGEYLDITCALTGSGREDEGTDIVASMGVAFGGGFPLELSKPFVAGSGSLCTPVSVLTLLSSGRVSIGAICCAADVDQDNQTCTPVDFRGLPEQGLNEAPPESRPNTDASSTGGAAALAPKHPSSFPGWSNDGAAVVADQKVSAPFAKTVKTPEQILAETQLEIGSLSSKIHAIVGKHRSLVPKWNVEVMLQTARTNQHGSLAGHRSMYENLKIELKIQKLAASCRYPQDKRWILEQIDSAYGHAKGELFGVTKLWNKLKDEFGVSEDENAGSDDEAAPPVTKLLEGPLASSFPGWSNDGAAVVVEQKVSAPLGKLKARLKNTSSKMQGLLDGARASVDPPPGDSSSAQVLLGAFPGLTVEQSSLVCSLEKEITKIVNDGAPQESVDKLPDILAK